MRKAWLPAYASAMVLRCCRPSACARRCCGCWWRTAQPELVATMFDHGLITRVLPVAPRLTVLARLAAVEAALARPPDGILRLAALAVAVPDDAQRLGERLRLSNEDTERLRRAAERTPEIAPQCPKTKPEHTSTGTAIRPTATACCWHGRLRPRRRTIPVGARGSPCQSAGSRRRFPIGGADVKALGVPAGPRIGHVLAALEAWWIASDFTAGDTALRAKLHELVAANGTT